MAASEALRRFLAGLGLEDYAEALGAERIEPEDLPLLSDEDLRSLGLPLGPRRRLQRALTEQPPAPPVAPQGPAAPERPAMSVPDQERRNLTILFCDMANSTSAAVALDPEDLRTRFRTFRAACTAAIEAEEGFAAHRLGDGIMAYFGYPAASEDAAICAVRAGHEIVARVGRLEAPGGRMSVRVGIATGLTVIEDFRDSMVERDEIATGATLALASRMQSMAEPGQVLLADTTRRLLRDQFALRSLGHQKLKGFSEPEEVWLSEGPRAGTTPGQGPEHDRMVGRRAERDRLLKAWEACRAGVGGAIVIEGDAGVGKSRLLAEVAQAGRETGSLISLQCQRHRHGATLHPVTDWLEKAARDVEGGLAALPGVTPETAPLLGTLMGGETGLPPPPADDPRPLQDSILAAVTSLLSTPPPDAAAPCRMVLVEDLHWADEATRTMLGRLVERVSDEPVLLVGTARPKSGYSAPEGVETIGLSPLPPEATEALIARQTGAEALTPGLRRVIAERSGGVPLFAEELTRAMLESPANGSEVPFTLQDTLMARLDRLGHGKPLAQLGALFGREFSHELLAACTDMDGETLQQGLAALTDSDLVAVSDNGGRIYTFRHSLIRDVAYDSMLRTRRINLHRLVAGVIGERFPQLARSQPERQAHHYTEAGDFGQAVPHWEQAAELALTKGSSEAAAEYFGTALSLLERTPSSAQRTETEITLRVRLNMALTVTTGFSSAATEENLARLETLYDELKPDPAALQLLWSNAMSALVKSDLVRARSATLQLERLSRQASLPNATRLPDRLLGYISLLEGETEQAEAFFGRVFDGYAPDGPDPILQGHPFDVLAASLSQYAILKALRDDPAAVEDCQRRAMQRLESFDSPATTFQVLVHLCVARFEMEDHDRVPPLVAGLREVVDKNGIVPLYVEIWEGWLQARAGDLEGGLHAMEVAQTQRQQYGLWMPGCTLLRVRLLADAGRHDAALELLNRCDTEIARYRHAYLRPEALRRRALSRRAQGAPAIEVRDLLERAAGSARRQGMLRFERLAREALSGLRSAPV
ncbi:ATP-binding protein [Allosediminivita pacifica]|uniref:SAM (Sterile alpha motif) domain-containing protein n=1 Tax=Allosediminivita pacifica TaxID=1267769 RepID=A0A2T6AX86_9RHOB|nr:AAA family ATPase [Allosediminivita pacifica]PTX48406.1 SAM (Sterile alpha motif) domain-containing protein [Allosediminivita pacifica]GGB10743.1 adenylate cyclase [Allosediminivita pacifica]